ncbi:MAG: glycosyltransferase family 4 protein [Saprospiraceae bacterium]
MTESTNNQRHILFVLEHFAPMQGGLETLFLALCKKLTLRGQRVTVLTTLTDRTSPRQEKDGLLTIRRYRFRNRYAFTLFALGPILRHGRSCDLIQTTSYNAGLPAFLGGMLLRKPVVITFHEVWGDLWCKLPFLTGIQRTGFFLFEKLLTKLPFTRFVAVSESTKAQLIKAGVLSRKITMIYNGLDYQEIQELTTNIPPDSSDTGTFTFTYFGRLGVSKGLELLLPAFAQLLEQHQDCRLQLNIPSAPRHIRQWIDQSISKLGISGSVHILQPTTFSGLLSRIGQSDAVVIPSWTEGFCFAAAETQAVGTPIVSSGRASLAEVVSGKYMEMTDQTTEALVEAMTQARLGKWSERPARRFELRDTIDGYLSVYQEVSR